MEYLREISRRNSMKVCGVSPRVFAEFLRKISRNEKIVCANLRELSRSFLRESSRLRIFVRGVNVKQELFLGLICTCRSRWSTWLKILSSVISFSYFTILQIKNAEETILTRAGICKTLCPQHLLAPKYGQICIAVIPHQILDFAQTFNR